MGQAGRQAGSLHLHCPAPAALAALPDDKRPTFALQPRSVTAEEPPAEGTGRRGRSCHPQPLPSLTRDLPSPPRPSARQRTPPPRREPRAPHARAHRSPVGAGRGGGKGARSPPGRGGRRRGKPGANSACDSGNTRLLHQVSGRGRKSKPTREEEAAQPPRCRSPARPARLSPALPSPPPRSPPPSRAGPGRPHPRQPCSRPIRGCRGGAGRVPLLGRLPRGPPAPLSVCPPLKLAEPARGRLSERRALGGGALPRSLGRVVGEAAPEDRCWGLPPGKGPGRSSRVPRRCGAVSPLL